MVPYETIVKELEEDTVEASANMGLSGQRFAPGTYPQAVVIQIKVHHDVTWSHDCHVISSH